MSSSRLFTGVMWAFTCPRVSRGCLEFEKRDRLVGMIALEIVTELLCDHTQTMGHVSSFHTRAHTHHTFIWTFMMLGRHKRVVCNMCWVIVFIMSSVKVCTCFVICSNC